MKKRIKKVWGAAMAFSLCAALTACSDKDSPSATPKPEVDGRKPHVASQGHVTLADLQNSPFLTPVVPFPSGWTPAMQGRWNYSAMYLFKKKNGGPYYEAYIFDKEADRAAASEDCNGTWDSSDGSCPTPGDQCGVRESDLTIICCG